MTTMQFAAPLWLLLLIPWTAALVWALVGRVDFARVPALFLWDKSEVELSRERKLRRPPAWVLWLLSAALAAILGASGLSLWSPWGGGRATVVVDCGLSMSPAGRVADALAGTRLGAVRVVCVPGDVLQNDDGVPIDRLRFTAAPTRALLDRTVRQTLDEQRGRVIVVTDQPLDVADERLLVLRPRIGLDNVSIEQFSVVEHASQAQAMVRIYNDSTSASAMLIVDRLRQEIDLPTRGTSRDYFVDLPAVGSAASAQVVVKDDLPADNAAWVTQQRAWPRVEARSGVSAAVQRMIDVYTRQRPPGDTSRTVAVVEGFFSLPDAAPAVALAPTGGGQLLGESQRVRMEFDHPLTRGVDWPSLIAGARGHAGPGEGWQAVVSHGDRVLVAVRELNDGVRQVWVGIDAPDFALRPDFVVFFANVFDWLGESTGGYGSRAAGTLGRAYEPLARSDERIADAPGLYRRADGEMAATAVAPVRGHLTASPGPPPAGLGGGGFSSLAGLLLLAALGCVAMGVLRLTRI